MKGPVFDEMTVVSAAAPGGSRAAAEFMRKER